MPFLRAEWGGTLHLVRRSPKDSCLETKCGSDIPEDEPVEYRAPRGKKWNTGTHGDVCGPCYGYEPKATRPTKKSAPKPVAESKVRVALPKKYACRKCPRRFGRDGNRIRHEARCNASSAQPKAPGRPGPAKARVRAKPSKPVTADESATVAVDMLRGDATWLRDLLVEELWDKAVTTDTRLRVSRLVQLLEAA